VPHDGPARVLVGRHGAASSNLNASVSLNYLAVGLRGGRSWQYQPPADHEVGWISVSRGHLRVPEPVDARELVVFASSDLAIEMTADVDTEFVIGSAVPHPYELALGNYSVHTSAAALRAGERAPQRDSTPAA